MEMNWNILTIDLVGKLNHKEFKFSTKETIFDIQNFVRLFRR